MTTTNVKVKFLTKAAIIAALYIVSTMLISPIAFGENQVRVSEALNILVFFTPAAIPGLFVGCILSNLASPFGLIDIAFGSIATLLAAITASKIKNKYLMELPSIIYNGIFVGFVLYKMAAIPFVAGFISVCIGQAVSLYVIGLPLLLIIEKNQKLRSLLSD
ncbi:QueT transporter family protein [Anaerofustis sp.]|uniref:QueT transporter family protein n=1 Tax=Anaerofustis sp. TaxID=1872517 RepID=UPI0025C5F386|nr:QueT transporter family protein [Anaerofustis sp.]